MSKTTVVNSCPALPLLGVLFVALKLTGVINWSWWWVTAPFWGGLALIIAVLLACIPLAIVGVLAADKVSAKFARR